MIAIVCPLVFLAGLVDSVAGGGGLLTLPAYLAVGLPAHLAAGTNKFSAAFGTLLSAVRYARAGKMHLKAAALSAVLALPGSALGAWLAMRISAELLRGLVLCCLPFAAVVVLSPKARLAVQPLRTRGLYGICAALGFFIGMYDGLVGPGTGTFLILGYTALCGFDDTTASGNAKLTNLASNLAAFVSFAWRGQVFWALGFPAMLCGLLGNAVGSGLAIRRGKRIIRPMLVVVLLLIGIRMLWDLLHGVLDNAG
jgi:uncharacterized membrane protein YfcA